MTAALNLAYAVRNAPMRTWPYHHIVVEDVFPPDLYRAMRENLPPLEAYRKLGDTGRVPKGSYPQRHVLYLGNPEYMQMMDADACGFWAEVSEWLLSVEVTKAFVDAFKPVLKQRFAGHVNLRSEACLMNDAPGYALGPHTDSPRKAISALFYMPDPDPAPEYLIDVPLPINWRLRESLGTSLYAPKQRDFTCAGGPHHPHDRFDRVLTVPFRPNTLFAFAKTDNSFHGVERVAEDAPHRELMLYDVFREE